jgi:ribosomal protein S20
MAERLKRYRPLGVSVPTVPTVDYVAAGRAQARAYDAISRGLDSMTSYALKRFEEKALIEGAQYGAENAPTMQQLQDAQGDIEDLVPGDQTTVFGRAARKTALASMETNFEISARQDMNTLRIRAEVEGMDTAAFTEQSNAIIDGYTSTLQDIDASSALKFRATMATVGNSALLAHAQSQLKQQQEEREALAISAADAIVNGLVDADGNKFLDSNIEDVFAAGSQPASEGTEYIGIAQKLEALRYGLQNILTDVGDKSSVKTYMKSFDDKVNSLYAANVSDWVGQSSIDHLNQWESGDIEDIRMQDFYNNMTIEQRQFATEEAQTKIKSRLSTESAIFEQGKRVRAEKTDDLLLEIFNGRIKGENYSDALSELEQVNSEEFIKIATEIQKAGAIDDQITVLQLTMASVDGSLTMGLVTDAYSRGLLSNTTAASMMGKVKSGRDEQHTEAMRYAKSVLMPRPDAMSFSFTPEDKIAAKKVADIEARLILAYRANPDMDRFEFVKKLADEANTVTEKDKDALKATARSEIDYYKGQGIIAKDATDQEAINAIIANEDINNDVAAGWKVLIP